MGKVVPFKATARAVATEVARRKNGQDYELPNDFGAELASPKKNKRARLLLTDAQLNGNSTEKYIAISKGLEKLEPEIAFGGNRLFGRYRLGLICELLGVSIATVLRATGISLDSWRSYESGRRKLPSDVKRALEDFVKSEFAKHCP